VRRSLPLGAGSAPAVDRAVDRLVRVPAAVRSLLGAGTVALAMAVGAATTPPPLGAQAPDPAADIARVERGLLPALEVEGRPRGPYTLEERMRHYGVPGVSIAVMDGGRIVWAKGYGVEEAGTDRPVTEATLFQAASISKPVAALGALRLVDDGRLTLDDDVNRWLRSWRVPASDAANGRAVTLRGLLTHTSGLTVHGFPGYVSGQDAPGTVGVLRGDGNTAAVLVDAEPGTLWRYSGGGYTVMQLLVEEVTGEPFADVMRRLVLEPLGMRQSTFEQPLTSGLRPHAAAGHAADGAAVSGRFHTYPEMAAAGLWTTPADLLRYAGGVHAAHDGEGGAVLSPGLARAMLTAGMGGYGLGPVVEGDGDALRFSHGGANRGFRAQFVSYARGGRGVAVMTNSDNGQRLAQEVVRAVVRAHDWPTGAAAAGSAIVPRPVVPVEIDAAGLLEYAGDYVRPGTGVHIRVAVEDGRLLVRLPGAAAEELIPVGGDRVFMLETALDWVFTRDAGGAVTGIDGPALDGFARR
jgi:CubicO group peptidase (beta-lactamase class C family)